MTRARHAWARRALAAVLPLAVACSDDPGTIRLPLVLETFESECGDLPCEWSRVTGSDDAVRRVQTIHPGVHGLRLEGEAAAASGPARVEGLSASGGFSRGPEVVYVPPPWDAPLGAQLTARCDRGGAIEVELTANVGVEGPDAPAPASVVYRGVLMPGRGFAPPARGLLAPDTPNERPADDAVVLGGETVTLRKTGPGFCEVALLVVGAPDAG